MAKKDNKVAAVLQFEVDESIPHFTIPGRLESYNEYIEKCRRNPYEAAKMKRRDMDMAEWYMSKSDIMDLKFETIIIHLRFFEPKKNRDKDNILGYALKVIQDSLQEMKIIKNDGWNDIENFTHDFFVDKEYPRIEVYVENVG